MLLRTSADEIFCLCNNGPVVLFLLLKLIRGPGYDVINNRQVAVHCTVCISSWCLVPTADLMMGLPTAPTTHSSRYYSDVIASALATM